MALERSASSTTWLFFVTFDVANAIVRVIGCCLGGVSLSFYSPTCLAASFHARTPALLSVVKLVAMQFATSKTDCATIKRHGTDGLLLLLLLLLPPCLSL